MANPQSDVGQVEFLTVRECAEALEINVQTFKDWLKKDRHSLATLLGPVRVGVKYGMLIIPSASFNQFRKQHWPAIRQSMEDRGWSPKKPGRLHGS